MESTIVNPIHNADRQERPVNETEQSKRHQKKERRKVYSREKVCTGSESHGSE